MMWNYPFNRFGTGIGFGPFGIILGVLFWIVVALIIAGIVRAIVGGGHHRHWENHGDGNVADGNDNALKILKERYAKGEISKKEFDSMKNDLL